MTDKEISVIFNCRRNSITQLLNKHGITNRKSKKENIELRNRISNSLIGRYVGKDNPNYKGYSDEKTIARGIFKTISKRLIRNADYTCSVCGKRGGDMNVHHIYPFSMIFDDFINIFYNGNIETIYDQLISYYPFTNESNLVVVCKECHRKIHSKDNHEPSLQIFLWEGATTIESTQ